MAKSSIQILKILAILIAHSTIWAQIPTPKPAFFGAYVDQSFTFGLSPFSVTKSLTNGHYSLELGWLEPVSSTSKGLFGSTFLNPSVAMTASPYSSSYAFSFNYRFLHWIEFATVYNRILYHKSLIGWDSVPSPSKWQASSVLERLPSDGIISGADVFVFRTRGMYECGIFAWQGLVALEQWNINADGNRFIYDFSHDMLLERRSNIYSYLSSVTLTPNAKWPFFVGVIGTWIEQTDNLRNTIGLGITSVPVKTGEISATLLGGYTTHDPLITDDDDWWERIRIALDLSWKLKFLAQNKSLN